MKKIEIIIAVIMFIIIMSLIGVSIWLYQNKIEIPYCQRSNFTFSDKDITWRVPITFFATDSENNIIEVEGLDFVDKNADIKFRNWNTSEVNEDGKVDISFDVYMFIPIEYTINTNIEIPEWHYSYNYTTPYLFDYYTGEILHAKNIVPEILNQKELELIDEINGVEHYKTSIRQKISYTISVSPDYDGLVVAINKQNDIPASNMPKDLIIPNNYYMMRVSEVFEDIKQEQLEALGQIEESNIKEDNDELELDNGIKQDLEELQFELDAD